MHGCSYKTFMNGEPHSFKGTEGVVGLKCWCRKDGASVLKLQMCEVGQSEFDMCRSRDGIRTRTLTLKGDDIEAYSNRFNELVLMCPELVSTESKKIEKYIRGFPERIKGNITSSKPATLHEAINMARELVELSVQGRAARIEYASSRTDEAGGKQFTMNQRPRSFNEATNAWKGKPNFNWAHAQTFTSPQNGSFSTYSSSCQMKLEKALTDFDSHQEKRLSSLGTQLRQQQDNMISKINLLWKTVFEKLDDTPARNTTRNPTAQMNFASIDYLTKEELRGKGIKSPSKLLSPKYLSQSSLAEQNKNPSSLKCVYFVNSIIILNKENEALDEGG
ncbi:hypothetical protein Tco_0211732 [Tanacetum coccineum]